MGGPTNLSFQREKEPTNAHPLSPAPRSTCQAGRLKNNGSTFQSKEGEDAADFLGSAEKLLSARDTALGRLCRSGHSETPRGGTLQQPPASGLREADSVYTCHEGGGRRRKPERSPKLLHSGREGAPARSSARWTPRGRAGHGGREGTAGCPRPSPGCRAPGHCSRRCQRRSASAEESRARAGARRPAPGPTPAGAPGQGDRPGRLLRNGGARRRHSPGSSRTVAMGMARRPGEELAPRGRTGYSDAELARAEGELLPALSAQRRHGRPPGVSALPRDPHPTTLRPLPPPPPPPPPPPRRPPPTPHTLPSCSGEPLLSLRHFRAQVARSGPGAGGCRGGGGHSRGISVTEFLLLRRRRAWNDVRHFGCGQTAFFLYSLESLKCGLRTSSLLARPSEAALPAADSSCSQPSYFTVAPARPPGSGLE